MPRAPSRAGWGEGVTLITLGRERSLGERAEPLAAPPSPRVSLQGRRQRARPAPAYSAAASSSSHPHRARPRGGACDPAPRAGPRAAGAPSARAPLPPPRARAPSPHSSGFRAGEVGLPSAPPNQRSRRCRPLPSPCAPARGRGLRAGRAARAGPEAGSPGASRASPECLGLRASWVTLRSPSLPRGAVPAPSCTRLLHPTQLEPQPRRHLARLRPVRPPRQPR